MDISTDSFATPEMTRSKMVHVAARGFTPIRHSFVQLTTPDGGRGSTLGDLVRARQGRALNAYLLLLLSNGRIEKTIEAKLPPLDAGVWARALSPATGHGPMWPAAAMTRVWGALEERGLITRERRWKRADVRANHELGNAPYVRPRPNLLGSVDPDDRYFTLPDTFWTEEWHHKLSLPGRALLLVVLSATSTRDSMYLPYDRGPEWYGLSRDTVAKGLHELAEHGLIKVDKQIIADAWVGVGFTTRFWYTPTGSFGRQARNAQSAAAASETRARQAQRAPEGA